MTNEMKAKIFFDRKKKKCKYCELLDSNNEGEDIILDSDNFWTDRYHLWKSNEGYRIECYGACSSPIKFCPMCGRKLND